MGLLSCVRNKPSQAAPDRLDTLGLSDYRNIVRHPISLDSSIDRSQVSEITFEVSELEFDTVESGDLIKHSFSFTNTGSKPLYILDTRVSCGCTVAAYPEGPISPGQGDEVSVEFDTKNKSGFQEKSIIVLTNSYPNENRLSLRGYVKN